MENINIILEQSSNAPLQSDAGVSHDEADFLQDMFEQSIDTAI